MLHRVIYGSIDRFIGILIENYAGAFPVWLAPIQVVINPVNTENHLKYAKQVYNKLNKNGIRVKLDDRNEKLGYRTREARLKKIPLQIVIGEEEIKNKTIAVKKLGEEETISYKVNDFIKMVNKLIKDRVNK
jgi:threonyl-tRNA synthetase